MKRSIYVAVVAVVVAVCGASLLSQAQDVGDPELAVTFQCPAPTAKAVYLAGEFNGWLNRDGDGKIKEDPAWLMKKDDFGNWKLTVKLQPGNYQYKFVVDGVWKLDAANLNTIDDGSGGKNSVKIVTK